MSHSDYILGALNAPLRVNGNLNFEHHVNELQDAESDPFGLQRIDDFFVNVWD
jgi:hypothetical protein